MSQKVQQTSFTQANQNFHLNLTLNGVGVGNMLVAMVLHANFTSNGIALTITDSQGQTVNQDARVNRANTFSLMIVSVATTLSGTHTLAFDSTGTGNATDSYYRAIMAEYAGLGAVDKTGTASNGASTGPISVTSGSPLSQPLEQVFAAGYNENGAAGTFGTPSGWNELIGSVTTMSAPEKIVNSTAAVTANFGTLNAANAWDAVIATYPIIAPAPATLQMLGLAPSVVGATNSILVPLTARVRDAFARSRRRWHQRDSGLLLPA